jgi:pantetheine-phosphate adenylyltransferase
MTRAAGSPEEVRSMRLAVYAGTFDPITCGHLSVIARCAGLFERTVVLIAVNPAKSPLFSLVDRLAMIRESTLGWSTVSADASEGLVVAYARAHGACALIRGIRGATDAAYETELAHLNFSLAPEITTLFVPSNPELSEVSSSRLKELARQGADLARYAPPPVLQRLALLAPQALASSQEANHEQV